MKVLLTATVQSHICQFHKPLVEVLHKHGCEVHVAAKDNLAEKNGLKLDFVEKVFNVPFARSPKSPDNIRAYRELRQIIDEGHYDVIHCNTPMGGIVTRLAARKARKQRTKVIYTAHGFHFYKGAPKKNWLTFFVIEKAFAKFYTDKLITISNEDYETAKRHHMGNDIHRIHGVGINSNKYHFYDENDIKETRKALNLEDKFVCICTGELNDNKRQRLVIAAMPDVIKEIKNVKLLLAGNGPNKDALEDLIEKMGLSEYVELIGYRTDLEQFVKSADCAISASLREGLGINLIEAMACKKPVLGSTNRGHSEFILNEVNGYLIPEYNFVNCLSALMIEIAKDFEKRKSLGAEALKTSKLYLDHSVKVELEHIYFGNHE